MAKELPIYQFGDDKFYVDIKKWEFRQVDNPTNTISLDHLQEKKDHNLLVYDIRTKNVYKGGLTSRKQLAEQTIIVNLPILARLDNKATHTAIQKFRSQVAKDLQKKTQEYKSAAKKNKGKKL